MLIIIHHLAVDGVSWRILMEDLESAYEKLRRGEPAQLLPKTTSYKRWSERLAEYAQTAGLRQESDYWLAVSSAQVSAIPVDYEQRSINTEASARDVFTSLSAEETQVLLQRAPAFYNTQINDVLLTVLARSISMWTKAESLLIDLEGHGREELFEDVDLTRTVGWFTSIFPVRLDVSAASDRSDALKSIKEHLRRIPNRGVGYGLLRYLCGDPEVTKKLESLPQAEVVFNYLGQFDQVLSGSSLFGFARGSCGPSHSPAGNRSHLLEVVGSVVEGKLQLRWTYSENVHRRETIEKLSQTFADELRSFVADCQFSKAKSYTPSDFPLARIDQQTLDQLLEGDRDIENIYPLSPMQQLFYSIDVSQLKGGFMQGRYTLRGDLDVSAFRRAWERVVNRHSILRTAFESERLNEPLQIVYRQVSLPWVQQDWRGLPHAEQEERLESFLRSDRERGFELSQAPLTRIALFRVAENTYQVVWSHHHLQIDGWSWPLVLKEVSTFYEALCRGEDLRCADSYPFGNYIEWLQRQDLSKAEAFWRQNLKGFAEPTPLLAAQTARGAIYQEHGHGEQAIRLPAALTSTLKLLAQQHKLTLNILVQGAWSLLLSKYYGKEDVVFGAAFSGRPAEQAGVESMVGPCVNNLPVRVRVSPGDPLLSWLKRLQEQQFELTNFQYTPLTQINELSEVTWRRRLFESLLVFQNYVVDDSSWRLNNLVEMCNFSSPVRTSYPVTLIAVPGPELLLKIVYHCHCFDASATTKMLLDLQSLLEGMAAGPAQRLSELLETLLSPTNSTQGRQALPESAYVAPRTEMEQTIATIWQEAFQVERVSIDDNFFDLGGHSILMTQVHSRLREALNTDLSIIKLFQYPTISSLARHISQELSEQLSYQHIRERARRQKKL